MVVWISVMLFGGYMLHICIHLLLVYGCCSECACNSAIYIVVILVVNKVRELAAGEAHLYMICNGFLC